MAEGTAGGQDESEADGQAVTWLGGMVGLWPPDEKSASRDAGP